MAAMAWELDCQNMLYAYSSIMQISGENSILIAQIYALKGIISDVFTAIIVNICGKRHIQKKIDFLTNFKLFYRTNLIHAVYCDFNSRRGQFEDRFFLSLISTLVAEYVTELLSGSMTCTRNTKTREHIIDPSSLLVHRSLIHRINLFINRDAILNFEHIAMYCGVSRVIQLFWTAINKISGE